MLSIKKSRELIEGDEEYSDEEIKEIRDRLYALGELAMGVYFKSKRRKEGMECSGVG